MILVVDDDEKSRRYAADVLEFNGFAVLRAGDGPEALHLVELHPVNLVLLDIQMPGPDGYEVLRAIRAHADTAALKVIAVTASVMPDQQGHMAEVGFDAVLTKPVPLKKLVTVVREVLARPPRDIALNER
jgi:two-component system cell cycle response regulator DivK